MSHLDDAQSPEQGGSRPTGGSEDSLFRIAAAVTGASILGIRQVNVVRTELLDRYPVAGRIVDGAIVVSLSGVQPGSQLVEMTGNGVATVTPEPVARASRTVGRVAGAVGRLVRLTGLDQPAPRPRS